MNSKNNVYKRMRMKIKLMSLSFASSVVVVFFGVMIVKVSYAENEESSGIKNESGKLSIIRTLLKEKKFSPTFEPEEKFCKRFMHDLLNGQHISAVEPDVRAFSEDDPQLKKWHQCEGITPDQMKTRDPKLGFDYISQIGSPPFRYYHIDFDGDPTNGKEDLLSHGPTAGSINPTGYTWVDLDGCFIKGNVPTGRQTRAPKKFQPLDLVARYKKEYVVLDMTPETNDPKISNYRFVLTLLNQQHHPKLCSWKER